MGIGTTSNERFDAFVDAARERPELWRLILGIIIVSAITFGGIVLTVVLGAALNRAAVGGQSTPHSVVLFLASIGFIWLGLALVLRVLHGRGLWTAVTGPLGKVRRHFVLGMGVYGLCRLAELAVWALFFDAVPNKPVLTTLIWLPPLAVVLMIQTGAEEVFFRGYILQQLAARFSHPAVWLIVPQVLFVLVHYESDGYGRLLWLVFGNIFLWAMIWADLTRITGDIGAAWGWHFVHNLMLGTLLTYQGTMDGISLYVTPYVAADTPPVLILGNFAVSIAAWMILRRVLLQDRALGGASGPA